MQSTRFVGPVLCIAALAGCVGELDNREDFLVGCSDEYVETDVLAASCGGSVCHDAEDPVAGLDLVSPEPGARLLGVPSSAACGERPLLDPADLAGSLLMEKLDGAPSCGAPMPLGGEPLDERARGCLDAWAERLAGGS